MRPIYVIQYTDFVQTLLGLEEYTYLPTYLRTWLNKLKNDDDEVVIKIVIIDMEKQKWVCHSIFFPDILV